MKRLQTRIAENIYGNWYGYIGAKNVQMFFNVRGLSNISKGQEIEAKAWLRCMEKCTDDELRKFYNEEN